MADRRTRGLKMGHPIFRVGLEYSPRIEDRWLGGNEISTKQNLQALDFSAVIQAAVSSLHVLTVAPSV